MISCKYICPNCYESVNSKWHNSEEAKKFKEQLIKNRKEVEK